MTQPAEAADSDPESERSLAPGGLTGGRESGLLGCVQDLARAARETSYLAMDRRQLEDYLQSVLGQLVRALIAEPFSTAAAYQIGTELVHAHFTGPEMSGRLVKILGSRLLPDLDLDTPTYRNRLAAVLGAISTSFARGLRDRTLDDQEEIRRAEIALRNQAQRELRVSEERRWAEARLDQLTSLPNRLGFIEHLGAAVADGRPSDRLGICLINLDRFRAVNDTIGPDAADELLVAVAERLRAHAPAGATLSRFGGDEFAVLVRGTSGPHDLVKLADTLLVALAARPLAAGATPLSLTASAGLIEGRASGVDADELLRQADIALLWAKTDGRSRWRLFETDRNAADTARWALAAELPHAIHAGQVIAHYQPMVSLADGRVHAVEALARWHHPERGLLLPGRFIPSAEETGLIVPLGRRILHAACAEAVTWAEVAPDPPLVSVNLAPRQLIEPDLLRDVLDALDATGLPAHRLQLEITETAAVLHDGALRTLHALADAGVRIAADDFGTGHANHVHLGRLPYHEMKLAAELTAGIGGPAGNATNQHLSASLIDLAHNLGLTVTAEGIETSDQAHWLHAASCDSAQG